MPDIELRFHNDMLVVSAPADAVLARQGINAARDRQYMNLMEPDAMGDALRLEIMAGAQCLATPTEDITRARLAHLNMDADMPRLAAAALEIANELKPQHILVEIGPCGLPLDPSSKASLNENRAQYADAARAFENSAVSAFDAFFLNGFTNLVDLKCALMGISQASGKPVFASVTIGVAHQAQDTPEAPKTTAQNAGKPADLPEIPGLEFVDDASAPPLPAAYRAPLDPACWPEAIDVMVDMGAAVVGLETAESVSKAVEYAQVAAQRTSRPIMAQLRVADQPAKGPASKGLVPLDDIDEYTPDTMQPAAVKLFAVGVQFLRATGAATPAYTGALAATVQGLDTRR